MTTIRKNDQNYYADIEKFRFGVVSLNEIATNIFNSISIEAEFLGDLRSGECSGSVRNCHFMFICSRSMLNRRRNEMDLSRIINDIEYCKKRKYRGTYIIKSDLMPGDCEKIKQITGIKKIIHSPDFKMSNEFYSDYKNLPIIIVSGHRLLTNRMEEMYKSYGVQTPFRRHTNHLTTEWAKNIHNAIHAIKLSFLNEIRPEFEDQKIFDEAVAMAEANKLIGEQNKVPGPTGRWGWAGQRLDSTMVTLKKRFPYHLSLIHI